MANLIPDPQRINNNENGWSVRTFLNGFLSILADGINSLNQSKADKTDIDKIKLQYYESEVVLKNSQPNPTVGQRALVGEPYPGKVWVCRTVGQWTNTNVAPTPEEVSLVDYAKSGGSNKTLQDVDSQIVPLLSSTNQLIDTTTFIKGNWYSYGSFMVSDNWICTPRTIIKEEIKGKIVTVSGGRSLSSGSPLVLVWDSEGNIGYNKLGGNTDTFTVPSNAASWAFNIANVIGIGNTPQENEYVTSFIVNKGTSALPFEPMNVINPQKINGGDIVNPFNFIISPKVPNPKDSLDSVNKQTLEKTFSQIAKVSDQLIDTTTFIKGNWYSDGRFMVSANWICTPKTIIKEEVKGKIVTVSGARSLSSGSPLVLVWDSEGNIVYNKVGGNTDTFTVPSNAVSWAFNIANVLGIGNTPQENEYVTSFMVNVGTTAFPFQEYGYVLKNISSGNLFDENEIIFIKDSVSNFSIYYHTKGASNDIWLKIGLIHATSNAKFVDVYRLEKASIVKRTDTFIFETVYQVIEGGVWENAMYTNGFGYTDALGSSHGCETIDSFKLFMDNVEIDLSATEIQKKSTSFYMTSVSKFKTPDGTGNVGQSAKRWDIIDNILIINNKIDWYTTINVGANGSYLSMLPVSRKTVDFIQVTNMATSNDTGIYYDVSESGFTTPIFIGLANPDPNRTRITICGQRFKASMSVTLRNPQLDNSYMFVQNTFYNKLYGSFGQTTVNDGDSWECTTEYDINVY